MDPKLEALAAQHAVSPSVAVEKLPIVYITPSLTEPLPRAYNHDKKDPPLPADEAVRVAVKTEEEFASSGARGENYDPKNMGEAPVRLHEAHDAFGQSHGMGSSTVRGANQLFKEMDSPTKGQPNRDDKEVDIAASAVMSPYTASKLGALLTEYDKQVVADSVQLRNFVTNKLLEATDCGQTRYELRALELLGKIADVGLFAEKVEVTVTHTAEALEHEFKDFIMRAKAADGMIEDAEFEEITEVSNGDEEGPEISESGSSGVQQTQENSEPS
jgi:hypothetical protein